MISSRVVLCYKSSLKKKLYCIKLLRVGICLLQGHRRAISINVPAIIEGCFQGYRLGHAGLRCVTEWFFSNYPQKLENVGLSVINGKGASRIGEGNMRSFFQILKQVFRWNIEYSEEWKI